MTRRNRGAANSAGPAAGGADSGGRGLGATIKRVLKIKAIILLVLIVLAFFGVLYIIDWVRGLFSSSADVYFNNQVAVVEMFREPGQ